MTQGMALSGTGTTVCLGSGCQLWPCENQPGFQTPFHLALEEVLCLQTEGGAVSYLGG